MTKGNATCETCPYWTEIDLPGVAAKGEECCRVGHCHHVANEVNERNYLDYNWWCSEHPDRQRDRLAAMAMQGLAAGQYGMGYDTEALAIRAYRLADAMLAERVRE